MGTGTGTLSLVEPEQAPAGPAPWLCRGVGRCHEPDSSPPWRGYVWAVISPDCNSSGFGLGFCSALKIYSPFPRVYQEWPPLQRGTPKRPLWSLGGDDVPGLTWLGLEQVPEGKGAARALEDALTHVFGCL